MRASHFDFYDKIGLMKNKADKKLKLAAACIIITFVYILIVNIAVVRIADPLIISSEDAFTLSREEGAFDCIMVLGASVSQYGPSPILSKRLDKGLELFSLGVSNIVLLSGDNGTIEYNEVQAMKDYIIYKGAGAGLTESNIYLDYAGFSTYYSAVRCKEVFGAERVVIVTQRYHLYRAVFIAHMIGLNVVGVAADDLAPGQEMRNLREIPARVKDFFLVLFDFTPSVMGDPVPLLYPSTQWVTEQ